MRIARLAGLALAIACAGACGDDGANPQVDATNVDAMVDSPDAMVPVTFTSFVIDLVENQTANDTDPVPYATFSTLDDPDRNNPAAYAVLFN